MVEGAPADFAVASFETRADMGASIHPDGAFVAERPGLYRVSASVAGRTGQVLVEVAGRAMDHDVVVTGRGLVPDRPTSDLWAFTGTDGRDYVYTGTHAGGQRMLAWDVTDPANPVLTDFVEVDARVVNDVKVNDDATVAVITREGASDRKNGIIVLDLADPAHPVIADSYTKDLTGGVHNVFFAGDILYAVHNGTFDVHILDISDPDDVEEVGRWGIDRPGKYLHDIWVVDGLAYVSYWNDGVYILDVGDGRWGGTPTEPGRGEKLRLRGGEHARRLPLHQRRRAQLSLRRRRDLRLRGLHLAQRTPGRRVARLRARPGHGGSGEPARGGSLRGAGGRARTTCGSRTTGCTWPTTRRGSGSWTCRANSGATSTGRDARSRGSRPGRRTGTWPIRRWRGDRSRSRGTSSSRT